MMNGGIGVVHVDIACRIDRAIESVARCDAHILVEWNRMLIEKKLLSPILQWI